MQVPEKIGRYDVERLLGHGGMAVVFLARDPRMDRLVAVKLLPRQFTFNDDLRQRFYREARIIAALEHPAIVPTYDFGEHEEQPYLVMRYMAGGSLGQRLEQPISLERTAAIFTRLAPALDKAHERGVIHRDLKPDNVLFDEDNFPYLADFGVARLAEATQTMTVVGTPSFMSPEQVQGNQELDRRCDVYALGVMLFLMLTGERPFAGDTPPKIMFKHVYEPVPDVLARRSELPAAVQAVVERAMAKKPADRYPSATALADAVNELTVTAPAPKPAATTEEIVEAPAPEKASPPAEATPSVEDAPAAETVVESSSAEPAATITAPEKPEPTPPPPAKPEPKRRRQIPEPAPQVSAGRSRRLSVWQWGGLAVVLALLAWSGSILLADDDPPATPTAGEASTMPTETPTRNAPPVSGQLGDTWTRPADGMEMVYVPAGSFLMGSPDSVSEFGVLPDQLPQHRVALDAFWIDRTEISNAQYATCVDDGVCEASRLADDEDFNGEAHPTVTVSWDDARTYCSWADASLPTEAQWEYAARGPQAPIYPWGDDRPTCELAQFDECRGQTVPVGSLRQGASWVGALDMIGNVWEWVQDWYHSDYYRESPTENPSGPTDGTSRVLRGGSWYIGRFFLRATYREEYAPSLEHQSFGFRCASAPG